MWGINAFGYNLYTYVKKFQGFSFYSLNGLLSDLSNLLDIQVRKVQVPRASVGPEEPHAASTTWPDGVMEKPVLDLLDSEAERIEFENFLRFELPSHPKLHRGQLKNGLRYLILPNKVPPNRYSSFAIVFSPGHDKHIV